MVFKIFLIVIFITCISARSTNEGEKETRQQDNVSELKSSFFSDLKYANQLYEECYFKELGIIPCLKMKLINGVDRLARKADILITDWISLSKVQSNEFNNEADSQVPVIPNTPRSLDEENSRLDSVLMDKIANFFSSRTIQLKLSGLKDLQKSFENSFEEERGKKSKYSSLMLYPLMMGTSMIPMALATLALLAGKALIIAKLALALTLIFGLKKLMGASEHTPYHVYSPSLGPYRRSFVDDEAAHSIAYRHYIPFTAESSTHQYKFSS